MFGERGRLSIDRENRIQPPGGRAWEYVLRSGLATALVVGGLALLETRRRDFLINSLMPSATAQGLETTLYLPLVMNRYQAEWQLGEPVPGVIIGSRFTIHNQRQDLRVAVHPLYGKGIVDGLVDKYKPDWIVEIMIVKTRDEVPPKIGEVEPGGVGTWIELPDGTIKLLYAENVAYDSVDREATYWFYPGDDFFATYGATPRTLGSDQTADADFTTGVIYFLAMATPDYLYPGGRELPPEAQADIAKFNGVRDDGGLNTALFQWPLPGPVLH